MNLNKKDIVSVVVIIALLVAGFIFLNKQPADKTQSLTPEIKNSITIVDSVGLETNEKNQIKAAIDAFMKEYKLPKGVESSYTLQIQERINNALQVETEPQQAQSDLHAVLFLKKTDGVWQIDLSTLPNCTLKQFEKGECE